MGTFWGWIWGLGTTRSDGLGSRIQKRIQKMNPKIFCLRLEWFDIFVLDPFFTSTDFVFLNPSIGYRFMFGSPEFVFELHPVFFFTPHHRFLDSLNSVLDFSLVMLVGADIQSARGRGLWVM